MATGDLVKLGTLYINNEKLLRPTRPWNNCSQERNPDIRDYYPEDIKGSIEIRDTDIDESYKIYWREVNIGAKKLLIADRNIAIVSRNSLSKNFLISGKSITIDGQKYIIRVLSGGTKKEDEVKYAEPDNEWDQIICNKGNFEKLPTPEYADFVKTNVVGVGHDICESQFNGESNKFWHWYSLGSIMCETSRDNFNYNVFRGANSVNALINWYSSNPSGWRPVLEVLNSPPDISDIDKSLGDKNSSFSVSYKVNDSNNDSLVITEKLNGNILRTLNNAPKGQDITINITQEQLYGLPLNQQNTITIQADDGQGGISYRNYTFKRTNTPPLINNIDKDLGVVTSIGEKYTVTDAEGNAITIVEKLDNTVLRTFNVETGKEYATTIDKDTWVRLKNGQHKYIIEATDSNGSKSTRVFSFTKKETKIDFTLAKPFTTDIKASKILVTPSWEIGGATVKVEACNNAFDAKQNWEDITKQVLINRHYNFTNSVKTADKWGINIRIYIEKDPSSVAEVSIKGFGGAFE